MQSGCQLLKSLRILLKSQKQLVRVNIIQSKFKPARATLSKIVSKKVGREEPRTRGCSGERLRFVLNFYSPPNYHTIYLICGPFITISKDMLKIYLCAWQYMLHIINNIDNIQYYYSIDMVTRHSIQ